MQENEWPEHSREVVQDSNNIALLETSFLKGLLSQACAKAIAYIRLIFTKPLS